MSDSDQLPVWHKDPAFTRTPQGVGGPPPPPKRPPSPPATPGESPGEALGLEDVSRPAPPSPFVREPARNSEPGDSTPPPFDRPVSAEEPPRPHLVEVEPAPRQIPVILPEPPVQEREEPRPPLPPAAAAPAPVVVHPPVPASELPPEPKAKKTPFWKKELSVGSRKSKAKQPKAKQQKQAAAVVVAAAVAAAETEVAAPKPARTSRFKSKPKSRSGGSAKRAPKPKTQKVKNDPTVVKTPVWKREVSLKKQERKRSNEESVKANKNLIGLKIGASQIAAAKVTNSGSAPELVQIARMELRPGIVVAGELRDPDALAEALKTFFDKNKLPTRGIRLGIANNRIGVRTFDVAGIHDPKQLDNAVRFRAQEALPIPIDEAVLDYQVLSEGVDEAGAPFKRILLVVAYRELVDRYVQACRKAGLRLVGIDLEAFALLRAISAPRTELDADGAVVAVSVGHQRSTFAVSDGRMCQFTRVLDWGGGSLDLAIARQLDITTAQAGMLKRGLSLVPGASVPAGISVEESVAALDAVRSSLQAFARELVSSLQFYQNQPESLGIGEIVLTGGTAHLPGIADELQRLTGVLVRVGDPLARVRVGKRVDEGDQIGSLAVAIGLGIED